MNKIEFVLSKYKGTIDDDKNDYLIVEIWIDGEPLVDHQAYATDLEALTDSIDKGGDYFIVTCWCGIPECAGIYTPIRVMHGDDMVSWGMAEPKPWRGLKFDRKQYAEAIEKLIRDGNELIDQLAVETGRKIEFTPDINKKYFTDPDKYKPDHYKTYRHRNNK